MLLSTEEDNRSNSRVQKVEHLEKDNYPDTPKTESTTFFIHSFNELLGSGLAYMYTIIANSNY